MLIDPSAIMLRDGFEVNNIRFGAVEDMLNEHGFVKNPKNDVWTNAEFGIIVQIESLHRTAEVQPQQVKRARNACRDVEKRRAVSVLEAAYNDAPLPGWLQLPEGYSATMRGDEIKVRKAGYPEARMRFTVKEGDRNPAAAFGRALDDFKLYAAKKAGLENDYGFRFQLDEGELAIIQKDYGVVTHIPAPANIESLVKNVYEMEAQADRKDREWEKLFNSLEAHGFDVQKRPELGSGVDVPVILRHAKLAEPVRIMLHGGELERGDTAGMEAIKSALEAIKQDMPRKAVLAVMPQGAPAIQPQESPPSVTPNHPNPESIATDKNPFILKRPSMFADYIPKPKPTLPDEQKTSLILDSNILMDLASPRGYDRTWLDILPVTAELPTVDKIYIPASVADWEVRGGVTARVKDSNPEFIRIYPNFADPKSDKGKTAVPIEALLATAGRSVLNDDGTRRLILGTNPDIVIYETAIDKEFARRVLEIKNDGLNEKIRRYDNLEAEFKKRNNEQDLGESSMEQIARNLSGTGSAYLVTNDTKFLRARSTELKTKDARPVGESTLVGLIQTEVEVRGDDFKKRMETAYGKPVDEFSFDRFQHDVMLSRVSPIVENPDWYPFSKPGLYKEPGESNCTGETLDSIFRRGAAMARAQSPELPAPSAAHGLIAPSENIGPAPSAPSEAAAVLPLPPMPLPSKNGVKEPMHAISPEPASPVSSDIPQIPPADADAKPAKRNFREMVAQIRSSPEPYIGSLGHKISYHRYQRGMRERDLAAAVRAIAEYHPEITEAKVFDWQTNSNLPEPKEYEALAHVLIDENAELSDKLTARSEFDAAYRRSQTANHAGQAAYETRESFKEDNVAFIRAMALYRKLAGLYEDSALAEKVLARLRPDIKEAPEEINAALMFSIGAGARPSAGLLKAIVTVLDEHRPLEPTEKQEIFDAYARGEHRDAKMTATEGKHSLQVRDDALNILRGEMGALFVKDGVVLTGSDIAGITGINASDISQMLGKTRVSLPSMSTEQLKRTAGKLSQVLESITGDEKQVARFNELVDRYIEQVEQRRAASR